MERRGFLAGLLGAVGGLVLPEPPRKTYSFLWEPPGGEWHIWLPAQRVQTAPLLVNGKVVGVITGFHLQNAHPWVVRRIADHF